MSDSDFNASSLIDSSIRELISVSSYDDKLQGLLDELNSINDSLSDFSREAESLVDEYSPDDSELDLLRARFELINDLERKYGKTIKDVLRFMEEKTDELQTLKNYEEEKERLKASFEKSEKALKEIADRITDIRKKNAVKFNKAMENALLDLNFNQSKFEVKIEPKDTFGEKGEDDIHFEISTNPGEPLKPLENVSSGGELSRIMLAIKTVAADKDDTDTMIFDEIDSGISGVTGWKVAQKLSLLSTQHQVICITHLQQIAAMSDAHYKIVKEVTGNKTVTLVNLLDEKGEIDEISRMLGDESSSESFKENAIEIKNRAKEFKMTR